MSRTIRKSLNGTRATVLCLLLWLSGVAFGVYWSGAAGTTASLVGLVLLLACLPVVWSAPSSDDPERER